MRDGQPRIESRRMFILRVLKTRETTERIKSSEKNRVTECCENLGRKIF